MKALAGLLTVAADECREADPTGWTDVERDDVLDTLGPAAVEIAGLAARIRAAKVNGTPVPRPTPARRVVPPPPPTKPAPPARDDPPPSPPPGGGGS